MSLIKNQLIQHKLSNGQIDRILWIDNKYENCVTIDTNLDNKKAKPQVVSISYLEMLISNGDSEILNKDPHNIIFREEELSDKEKIIRDNRWKTIEKLIQLEPEIYIQSINSIYDQHLKNSGFSKRSVYDNLRIFWKKGNYINSLIPDYRNCGGREKKKKLRNAKTGRPSIYRGAQAGVNVTEEIEALFIKGLKKFKENKVTTVKDIYLDILNEFFVDSFRYENGMKVVTLKKELPTLRQFRYWYNKYSPLSEKQKIINRIGQKQQTLNYRPLLGKSDGLFKSPGSQYQIDSTVGDIYLVSEIDPDLIVGRPTVYFVRDVFSRLIVGMYVGLEESSWLAATMALANTVKNKVEYCKQFGIEIKAEEWPVQYLPECILADRAEFKGYKTENLIKELGVRVENTPSYRADLKGIIEQYFNMSNRKIKKYSPGVVTKDMSKRGEKDPRLEAALTIKDYTKAMIHVVLYYNNSHRLNGYENDLKLFKSNVPLIPIELWNWGIKNRSGKLRAYPEDIVILSLLPRIKGKVTKFGIHFQNGIHYSCELALKEDWYQEAAIKGSWSVELAYLPFDISKIYLVQKGSYEICTLLDKSIEYGGLHIDEIRRIKMEMKIRELDYEKVNLESAINLNSKLKNIESEAKLRIKKGSIKIKKTEKLKNIRKNRKKEKLRIYDLESELINKDMKVIKDIKEHPQEVTQENETVMSELSYITQFQKEMFKDEE